MNRFMVRCTYVSGSSGKILVSATDENDVYYKLQLMPEVQTVTSVERYVGMEQGNRLCYMCGSGNHEPEECRGCLICSIPTHEKQDCPSLGGEG